MHKKRQENLSMDMWNRAHSLRGVKEGDGISSKVLNSMGISLEAVKKLINDFEGKGDLELLRTRYLLLQGQKGC